MHRRPYLLINNGSVEARMRWREGEGRGHAISLLITVVRGNYVQNGHKSDQNSHTENPKRPQTKMAKTKTATTKSIHQNGEHVNK